MKVHIIPHTHWDREWYRTFNYFNIRLSYFFDSLFEILEADKNYNHFMLDGQMVMIEDYLLLRPEHKEQIKKYVEEKRIIIGPWYTQPDEFAPDAESLIRNLLIGINMAKEYGTYMNIGYLPDSFGHNAQLPHILQGFGIDSACIMRGVPTNDLDQSDFLWKSLNGEEVIGVSLPKGYSNGMFLPKEMNKMDMRVQETVTKLSAFKNQKDVLIMAGVDHQFPTTNIPEYISYKSDDKNTYIQSTLEDYIQGIDKKTLMTLQGELITPATNRVHTSMASTRMPQKKQNRELQILLEFHVEPYLALSWILGSSYPKHLINNAWKLLLKNQTHDSICGCCTDEVHKEIDQRFTDIKNIGTTLHNMNARALANKVSNGKRTLTVFNDSLVQGKRIVEAKVYTDLEDFGLLDSNNEQVKYVINDVRQVDAASLSIWSLYMDTPCIVFETSISIEVDFNFNYGYLIYEIVKGVIQDIEEYTTSQTVLENQYSRLTINENGTFDLYDKETTLELSNLNMFEDVADAGDTYNFCPLENDRRILSDKVTVVNKIVTTDALKTVATVNITMILPKSLIDNDSKRSDTVVSLPIETTITMYENVKRIDINTRFENNSLDHRLRVLFPTSLVTKVSHSEIQLGIIERPNQREHFKDWEKVKFKEKPLPIYPMQRFVSLKDKDHMVTIFNKGLTEYEIYDNNTIAITLLRSVGYMGKADLSVRPGRPSGMPIATPDAQCLGTHEFEYSILISSSNIENNILTNEAQVYTVPPKVIQNELPLTAMQNKLGPMLDLFNIETLQTKIEEEIIYSQSRKYITLNNNQIIITSIKKAENEDGLIIRLYNSGRNVVKNIKVEIGINIEKVYECNFLEDNLDLIKTNNNGFIVNNIKEYSSKTLKLMF